MLAKEVQGLKAEIALLKALNTGADDRVMAQRKVVTDALVQHRETELKLVEEITPRYPLYALYLG